MNNYPLPENTLSPYCRGYNINSAEIVQCCLNSCENRINYCIDTCKNNYGEKGKYPDFFENKRCYSQCQDLAYNCKVGCMEVKRIGEKNNYNTQLNREFFKKKDSNMYAILTSIGILISLIVFIVIYSYA